MGVTTTADLTQKQISYSPSNLTIPGPVKQGSSTLSPFNPEINQGSTTPTVSNPEINQGSSTPSPFETNIVQGSTDPLKVLPTIEQGSTDPSLTNYQINQGKTTPVITSPEIQQGTTTPIPSNSTITQGSTTPSSWNPIINQGITTPELPNINIQQGNVDITKSNPNIIQGNTNPILTNYNIEQGNSTPIAFNTNIEQGSSTPVVTDYNIVQGETTPRLPNVNIQQGITTPVLTNYNIEQGETTPTLPNINIRQGETTPTPSNPDIEQGNTTPILTNYNIEQGSTTPTISNPNVEQGSTTPSISNPNIEQGFTTPALTNYSIEQGETTPTLTNYNIQQGSTTPTVSNPNIEQGETTPILTNYNIQQGSTAPVLTNYNIEQGSTTPELPNIEIQQGETTPQLPNINIIQGETTPELTNYDIEQGSTTPTLTNYNIEQGSTDPVLTNYNIEQGETTPTFTNYDIEQGETTPTLTNYDIEQGETTPTLTNYNIQQGETTPVLTNYNIQQGETTPILTNYNIQQGETTPVLTNYNINQGAGSVVIYNPGPGLRASILFGQGQSPLLATSPLFSQTVPSTAPIVGGASLASLVTGGITAIAGQGNVGAQVVSIASYLGALPLSLYRRPDGLLLIGTQVAEAAFSHFMTRKHRILDSDFGANSTVNFSRFNKTGQQQILIDSNYESDAVINATDITTNVSRGTDPFNTERWDVDSIFYIDKLQIRTKGRYVDNINFGLFKTPVGNSYSMLDFDGNTFNKIGTIFHVYRPENKFLSDENLSDLYDINLQSAAFSGGSSNFVGPPAPGSSKFLTPYESDLENVQSPISPQKGVLIGHRDIDKNAHQWQAGIAGNYTAATLNYKELSERAAVSIEGSSLRPLKVEGSVDFSTDKKGVLSSYKPYSVIQIADVDPTDKDADANEPIDPIYSEEGFTNIENKDFIKLLFTDRRTGGLGTIQFRAYLEDFSDRFSHNWNDINYIGRPNTLKIFNNVSRDINLAFFVPALSRGELKWMYKKLERLAKMSLPTDIGIMTAPIVSVTVGDWFVDEICNITSLDFTIDSEHTWEINIEEDETNQVGELPHIVKVVVVLNVIGNEPMNQSYRVFGTNIIN